MRILFKCADIHTPLIIVVCISASRAFSETLSCVIFGIKTGVRTGEVANFKIAKIIRSRRALADT